MQRRAAAAAASKSGGTRSTIAVTRAAAVLIALASLGAGLVLLLSMTASSGRAAVQELNGGSTGGPLHATIRRTSHGIPHILADDFPGAGYGYGYAFAEDNICVLADIYVTVRGERSRFFGPDGSFTQGGNGASANNLNSDFFFQRIRDNGTIERLLELPPPRGPRPELKQGVRGFVAGYNRYLRETGVDNLPDASCRGKPWVREISEMDAYRRFYQLGLLASQGVALDGIGGAQPPVGAGPPPPTAEEIDQMLAELKGRLPLGGIGSNAYGLGSEATANGKGMVLGNPHFPWDGSERFYQAQITIPGQVNVSGGSLFGVPVVNIGHTDHLAWSHTVSTAFRFTPFELKLVPGSPTTYLYDGQPRRMTAEDVTVMVKTASGALEPRSRTLYSSHHGSILTSILGLPLFPWTPATAWAMGDANAGNFRYLNHFFEVNQAQSVDELHDIIVRNQGVPWVNTIAADSSGQALYADISVVPHVTNEKAATCNTELGRATYAALGLPTLDGSLSACEWGTDPDAVEPGLFGPSNLPELRRTDYVTNSNDSYWLSNPLAPLTGFDRIIGDEDTERSLRTRSGLIMVDERLRGVDGRPGDKYTLQQLQDTVFDNRQYAGELWRDELVAFCEQNPMLTGSSGNQVDVSEACPVLDSWDLKDDLDSRGAILFRRFASRALAVVGLERPPGIFDQEYSSAEPVHTPRGLNTENPRVQQALADAVSDLRGAGIPLDAPLRDWQYERRGTERIPIHGGPGSVGVFNAINVSWVGSGASPGYPNVPHGSSFVMAAQFTDDPSCPVDARTILTYSQSTNPASPWFADQTRMFSRKEWVDEPFCEDDIAADPNLEVTTLDEPPSYPRPNGAAKTRVTLTPAFDECTAPSSTHGAPLALGACEAQPSSNQLTVPGDDTSLANGSLVMRVRCSISETPPCPAPGEQEEVNLAVTANDVHRQSDNSDYDGELEARLPLRITDSLNGPDEIDGATVVDAGLSFAVPCAATTGPEGGACAVTTSGNALMPGLVRENGRAIWAVGQIAVHDGGADELAASVDGNTPFLRQAIFVP